MLYIPILGFFCLLYNFSIGILFLSFKEQVDLIQIVCCGFLDDEYIITVAIERYCQAFLSSSFDDYTG